MKKHYTSLVTVLGLAMFSQAFAAATTLQLKVLGTIGIPGCIVTMDGGSDYDYGKISPTLIQSEVTHTALPWITKELTVKCDASTYLIFSVTDAEEASASIPDPSHFGLGKVNGTGNLGYYKVIMNQPRISSGANPERDARLYSTYSGAFGAGLSVALFRDNAVNHKLGWGHITANELVAADTFKAKFTVAPQLGGTTTMNGPVTETVKMAGSLTLNFAFGL